MIHIHGHHRRLEDLVRSVDIADPEHFLAFAKCMLGGIYINHFRFMPLMRLTSRCIPSYSWATSAFSRPF